MQGLKETRHNNKSSTSSNATTRWPPINSKGLFITDITKWLEEGKKEGELFIVGGDFNEILKIGLTLL
eukprot:8892817-Ditylum_brightwellii.AAC.1